MANIVIAIATVVIAIYAIMSYRLVSKIQSRDDEFRKQVRDLYKAIVVSNLIVPEVLTQGGSTLGGRIRIFKEYYKGETTIFD